jgi:hypothetical protein
MPQCDKSSGRRIQGCGPPVTDRLARIYRFCRGVRNAGCLSGSPHPCVSNAHGNPGGRKGGIWRRVLEARARPHGSLDGTSVSAPAGRPEELTRALRSILPRSRHLPRASTGGSSTRNPNKTGVRFWTAPSSDRSWGGRRIVPAAVRNTQINMTGIPAPESCLHTLLLDGNGTTTGQSG